MRGAFFPRTAGDASTESTLRHERQRIECPRNWEVRRNGLAQTGHATLAMAGLLGRVFLGGISGFRPECEAQCGTAKRAQLCCRFSMTSTDGVSQTEGISMLSPYF